MQLLQTAFLLVDEIINFITNEISLFKFLPQRSGDIIREVIHKPAGDGSVGAEDEAVVNLAVALHPAARAVQPLDIQKPLIDSMGERQLAVHIASTSQRPRRNPKLIPGVHDVIFNLLPHEVCKAFIDLPQES